MYPGGVQYPWAHFRILHTIPTIPKFKKIFMTFLQIECFLPIKYRKKLTRSLITSSQGFLIPMQYIVRIDIVKSISVLSKNHEILELKS